jgi:hypothetical protein
MDFIASPIGQSEIPFLHSNASQLDGKASEPVRNEMYDRALELEAALHAEHSCGGIRRRSQVAQLAASTLRERSASSVMKLSES